MLIDPAEAKPILNFLKKHGKGIKIAAIFCTHKHWDHVGGADKIIKFCVDNYG